MPASGALERDVRLYVYAQIIETSAAPSVAETAAALGIGRDAAEAAFRRLDEARALVLRPGTATIWMAMPFSNVQTAYTVISGGRAYYANSAWDALGVAALLQADARVFTTCADCGGALERKIAGGGPTDTRGVVHFAIPPRRWWDDIGLTCATTLLFGSEEHVDRWCARREMARGSLATLEQTWSLARACYGGRLDAEWRPQTPAETAAAFSTAGLNGAFWDIR
jgi:hypothetical protein